MTEPPPLRAESVRYAYVCHVCGSDHVTRDAWAMWDVDAQAWVLDTAFDYAHCHRCMGDTRLEQVVVTSPVTFAAPCPSLPTGSGQCR
jgi:hypothetical protein